jgi:PKD repeat protein
VRLDVKADALGSADPVAALSEVTAEASSSPASGPLTVSIDFGDGTIAATANARHVYGAAGTFTITATVTDGQSRKATDTRQITVKAVSGSWFQAEYVRRTERVEVRRLRVDSQSGASLRGVYQVTGSPDRAFNGTLTPPRSLRISLADGATLDGVLPSRLDDQAVPWTLEAHGDAVDGERLEFRRVAGEPATPPPNAELKISFGPADAWSPYAALTPVQIDATVSRGTGLTYFIDFGDGFIATTPQTAHVINERPYFSALPGRVTVVDAFGRSDTESFSYFVFELGIASPGCNVCGDFWTSDSSATPLGLKIEFTSRTGLNYVGRAQLDFNVPLRRTPALATLSAGPHIRITLPEQGIEYEGSITMSRGNNALMTVVQRGGADNGKTWRLERRSSF